MSKCTVTAAGQTVQPEGCTGNETCKSFLCPKRVAPRALDTITLRLLEEDHLRLGVDRLFDHIPAEEETTSAAVGK